MQPHGSADEEHVAQMQDGHDPLVARKEALYERLLQIVTTEFLGNHTKISAAQGKDRRPEVLEALLKVMKLLEEDKAGRDHLLDVLRKKGLIKDQKERLKTTEARLQELQAEVDPLAAEVKTLREQNADLATKNKRLRAFVAAAKRDPTTLLNELQRSEASAKNAATEKEESGHNVPDNSKQADFQKANSDRTKSFGLPSSSKQHRPQPLSDAEQQERERHIKDVKLHLDALYPYLHVGDQFELHKLEHRDVQEVSWTLRLPTRTAKLKELYGALETNDWIQVKIEERKWYADVRFGRALSKEVTTQREVTAVRARLANLELALEGTDDLVADVRHDMSKEQHWSYEMDRWRTEVLVPGLRQLSRRTGTGWDRRPVEVSEDELD